MTSAFNQDIDMVSRSIREAKAANAEGDSHRAGLLITDAALRLRLVKREIDRRPAARTAHQETLDLLERVADRLRGAAADDQGGAQ